MKKFSIKCLTLGLITLALGILSVFSFNVKANSYAEEVPSYFTVIQYSNYDSQSPEYNMAYANIKNGDTAYVRYGHTVKAELKLPADSEFKIKHITPYITLDKKTYSNTDLHARGVTVNYSNDSFSIVSSTSREDFNPYARYDLFINYIIEENGVDNNKSFTFTYYILAELDYYNGTNVQSSFNLPQEHATKAGKYDRVYIYQYQQSHTNNLPFLTYNKKNFNVKISKTFQKGTYIQNIWYNGTQLETDNNLVYIIENLDNDNVVIYFNNLGLYEISYSFIYTYDGYVDTLLPINNIENSSSLTNIKRIDGIEICGYQAFYSDINSETLKEFKNIQNGVIGNEITDITFLSRNTFGATLGEFTNSDDQNLQDARNLLNAFKNSGYKISSTNQAPVQFVYNVELYNNEKSDNKTAQSKYWKLSYDKDTEDFLFQTYMGNPLTIDYDNSPFTQAGIYLLKLVYENHSLVSSSGDDSNCATTKIKEESVEGVSDKKLRCQWFLFEITSNTTEMDITEYIENGKSLFDGSYTNKDVTISKKTQNDDSLTNMFDAVTELRVYRKASFVGEETYVGTVNPSEDFVVSDNGTYRVVMMFGKNLTRSYSSTFIIDKTPIENIQIVSLNKIDSDYYVKDKNIEFLTNQPVMVSWNEKDSGSTTSAEYKFIPLVKDTEMDYNNSLEYLYSYGAVPVNYMFDNQNNTELRSILYSNNLTSDYVRSTNVLTQAGMYIFHIVDTAGNEKYFAFVIDNTENRILQKVNGQFIEPEGLNILSSNVTIAWGNRKIIKFNNIKRISGKVVDSDSWLCKILNDTDVFSNYFEMRGIHTVNTFFAKIPINDTVWYSIGGNNNFVLNGTDHMDIEFLIRDENNNLVANELQYIFYTRDASNTKVLAGYSENSFDNYEVNYSGSHSVILSSDASRTVITYSSNDVTKSLIQEAYSSSTSTQKNKYYTPTTKAMLAESNEVINLTFNPTPENGVLEIEEVKYVYTPFSKRSYLSQSDISYGYKFDAPENEVIIYSRIDSSLNLVTVNPDGTFSWDIKKEYEYNPNDPISYKTREGKYTITRKYANLSSTESKLEQSHDYMIRTFTFIVDRNGIITTPSIVDEAGTMFNYVGESIKLQVLESNNEGKMFFKDVYIASNDQNGSTVILATNKLPVFVYIPVVKYGYSYESKQTFHKENSISFWEESLESEIASYALTAQIRYSAELSGLNQSTEIYTSNLTPTDGYLRFDSNTSQSGRAFTKVGYYKVIINQGYRGYGSNTFNFIFQISQTEPRFVITDTINNEELKSLNNLYYTNKESIRLAWTDSDNQFEAKINTKAIYYSVNDTNPVQIDESLITTNGNNHYFDLSLKDIGAYTHGSKITVQMQFEGDEKDYNRGYFKTSKTVVVDTVAPTENIFRLIELYGLDANLVRNYGIGYNTSVNTGIYRYFAYAIDKHQIADIIDLTPYKNESGSILYREFKNTITGEGTKYNDIYTQETLPSTIESSTIDFKSILENYQTIEQFAEDMALTYYLEIVEIDLAGNITIYTIYITDYEAMTETNVTPITYTTSDNEKVMFYSNLKSNIDIFAKNNFNLDTINLFNYPWSKITVNGVNYVRTPYSDGKYYNLATYNPSNVQDSQVELSEVTRFLSSSQKQTVEIGFVPYFNRMVFNCSVLNSSLSVLHTSQVSAYKAEEGLLIKVPTNATANDASIYATYLEVVHYVENPNGMSYTQETLYKKIDNVYFASNDRVLDNTSFISSVYVNYLGSTYLKVTINEPQKDRFYKYFVKDNFLDEYSFTNIYGSQVVEKPLYSDVDLVENYESGVRYYYSTKDITYVFNYKKDKITLSLNSTPRVFNIAYAHKDVTDFKNLGYGNVSFNGDLCTVVLYAPKQDMSNNITGGERTFTIRVYEAIENIGNGLPYNTIHLDIYNIIPSISLLDIYNNNQNALFSKDTMYGNELRITYTQTTGKIPCQIYLETEDGTIEQITSGKLVSLPGQYSIIVRYTELFLARQYDTYLDFIISDNDEDFYQVKYKNNDSYLIANPTGNSFSYTENTITYTIATHYILNTSEFEIICNTDQDVSARDVETIRNGSYVTYIYEVSNTSSTSASKYFTRNIAITVIPKSNTILTNYAYYTNEGTKTLFDLSKTQESFVVSTEESNSSYKRLTWQSYYGIPENKVNVKIYFGDNQTLYTPVTTYENNFTTITLKSSGTYYLTFSDMAGNVHMFNQLVSTYTIRYLRSVIYTVNGESPINNAVYDKQVDITIPASTIKYYDSNAQPVISVLRNGEVYQPEYTRLTRTYSFTEAGLYKVWFSAAVTENGIVKNINEQPLYFLIIRPKESRSAFELSEYADYYVESIIKDGVDITKSITNENMGKLVTKTVKNEEDVFVDKVYLKSLLISVNDAVTGAGNYTITVNTDNEFGQTYTFDFWINNKQAPINVSIPENTSTTSVITVSFNTADLLEDVGDCVLKISGYNDAVNISSKDLADGKLNKSYNIKIDKTGTHFIQLYSESGKLLYSYKVIKAEPLNAVSIIVIVVTSILVVVGAVVFIRLRKRMKIR